SVSKRSNAPSSRVRISSASAPSCAVTMSWPSMAIARATSARMESSSSAIRTRGIGRPSLTPDLLRVAAGEIAPVEEAYIDIASFRGRRGEARFEPGALARLQHGLVQHRVPGVDFGALRVANGKAQPRQFDRLLGFADDDALDHQHRLAIHGFRRDLDVLEQHPAQVHVEPDHLVERSGLR